MPQHGVAVAARFYSRKLGQSVSETTASSLKKAYLQGVKEKEKVVSDFPTMQPENQSEFVLVKLSLGKE